jgi:hypothetical protein
MSRHELDRAQLLSSLRVALDELAASPDAERQCEGIWQLRETLENWIAKLDAQARFSVSDKHDADAKPIASVS